MSRDRGSAARVRAALLVAPTLASGTAAVVRLRYGQLEPVALSEQQVRMLAFVMNYATVFGYPPSLRTIGAALDLASTSSVHQHLTRLRRQGFIDWQDGKSRTLQPTMRAVALHEVVNPPRRDDGTL